MRFASLLFAAALVACAQPTNLKPRAYTDAEVARIHKELLLVDGHNDFTSFSVTGADITKPNPKLQTDLARLREGNVGAQFWAAYVAATFAKDGKAAHRTLEMIDTIRHDIIGLHPNEFMLAVTADDILKARKEGKIASLIGIEGGHAIENNLRLLRTYFDLGVRYMTLTHTNHNEWADSSGTSPGPHNGLNAFGKQVIGEMNRLGMMIDVAHVADKTFFDALSVSRAPIFSSHSSCRALSGHRRNMTDQMIQAMANKGGVIMINFSCEYLSQSYFENPKGKRPGLDSVVAQIDHAVKVAGIEGVGLGSDFDGVSCVPDGLSDVSMFPRLTKALLEKGYSQEHLAKIYGANILRVMRANEKAAAKS